MQPLNSLVQLGVYALMGFSVIAAIGVVTLRNLFHAALALVGTLLGVAGIYLALQAEFLAVVQILIYVGAVMTLVIFAIMLTERFATSARPQNNDLGLPAIAGAIIFFIILRKIIFITQWPVKAATQAAKVDTLQLGQAFMTTYAFPFEVISTILLAALIGAIIIAKKDK